MTVTVRPAAPGDAGRLAAIGQASFLEAFAGDLGGDDILAHCAVQHAVTLYEGWLADGAKRLWLAEAEGGAPVGYAVSAPPDLPLPDLGPHDIEVKRIYVLHRFHGGGVGWRLMQAALDEARRVGRRRALLGVYSGNAQAIAFYERVGFRRVGERKFRVGETWCDDFIFGMMIADPIVG
jgi:ribosomal protein S18 acetylase RimI-like enzyme